MTSQPAKKRFESSELCLFAFLLCFVLLLLCVCVCVCVCFFFCEQKLAKMNESSLNKGRPTIYLSLEPVLDRVCLSLASRRLHFPGQTGLKSGCLVTQLNFCPSWRSSPTISLVRLIKSSLLSLRLCLSGDRSNSGSPRYTCV